MNRFTYFFLRYKLHHLLFWLVYYVGWVQVYKDFYARRSDLLLITLIYALAHATMFYVTQYVLIPRLLRRKKPILFGLAFISLLAGTTVLMYAAIGWVLGNVTSFGVSVGQFMITLAASSVFMTGVLLSIKGLFDHQRNIRIQERREKERLQSELQFLKSQVNPHFLFNAINSVYVLIKQDPDKASDTLIKLSDLLRTQLYEFGAEHISIEQELEYLENYIELERMRKGDKLIFGLQKGNGLSGFSIAPLMLIPFLENCFKHVSAAQGEPRRINVNLQRQGACFRASFFNTRDDATEQHASAPGGIGLKNIRRRLELLYPGGHTLELNPQPEGFTVNLSLAINE